MGTGEIITAYAEKILQRKADANKSVYGKLLIVGGSPGMAGAAYLSGLAAFRSGIGMVRYFGPEENRMILQTLLPEAMYTSGSSGTKGGSPSPYGSGSFHDRSALKQALDWADLVIAGPGLSKSDFARSALRQVLEADLSGKDLVLFDADALNLIAEEALPVPSRGNVVLTPHIGEMARLTGLPVPQILSDPAGIAAQYSLKHGCVTVLKNAVTYVSSPSGVVYENRTGHPAMAKAGSGDVLTGVIAGITAVIGAAAQEKKEAKSITVTAGAAAGTWIHGTAGTLAAEKTGIHSVLAHEIADSVPAAIAGIPYRK